jgi:hypothetical protein
VGGGTRFSIDGESSVFHFERYALFAGLPDLSLFVHDGFPFTRRPDLAETVAVLPDQPQPAEIATLLSVVAGLSAVTGRPASELTVVSATDLLRDPGPPRDLLVLGAAGNQPLLRAFGDRLPLRLGDGFPRLALPGRGPLATLQLLLAGRLFDGELGRGRAALSRMSRFAAVVSVQSPLAADRTAVFITAGDAADMPTLEALQGSAQSRYPGGDVLLVGAGERWLLRLGLPYQAGHLDRWHTFVWRLAEHWVALFPAALLGMAMLALAVRATLQARVRERLGEEAS